jgi:hypothetical protein
MLYINLFYILEIYENKMLRRINGPKRQDITGEWRKLHNESFRELRNFLSFMELDGSLPYSHVPYTGPYPEILE